MPMPPLLPHSTCAYQHKASTFWLSTFSTSPHSSFASVHSFSHNQIPSLDQGAEPLQSWPWFCGRKKCCLKEKKLEQLWEASAECSLSPKCLSSSDPDAFSCCFFCEFFSFHLPLFLFLCPLNAKETNSKLAVELVAGCQGDRRSIARLATASVL